MLSLKDLPGGSNTINNASTVSGWLEATGLDDLLASTCGCILGVQEEQPVQGQGARQGGQSVVNQFSSLFFFLLHF